MPLHILKLCVGADSIEDLAAWIAAHLDERRRSGEPARHRHTTRMAPRRVAEVLDGGSLFWVIRGQVAVRQAFADIAPFTDADGIGRCHLVLDPALVPVRSRPCRPFQGWRYLRHEDAPPDLGLAPPDLAALPEPLLRELRALGLM